ELAERASRLEPDEIKLSLKNAVPEYRPQLQSSINGTSRPDGAFAIVSANDRRNGHQPASAIRGANALDCVAHASAS
ncbi:MAG TPA: hypothetical protein VH598_05510, partial [Verrucomicrobiae bacterium]|nr:hypothetical protein [Verrucomicrobiae bacterium]